MDKFDEMSADDLRNELRSVVLQLCAANIKAANLEGQLRKADADKAVPVVGEPVAFVSPEELEHHKSSLRDNWRPQMTAKYVGKNTVALVEEPTDSIPRARLDELMAAEKNVTSLRASLSTLLEFVDDIPDANCSCHLCPPCNDCVEYGGLRLAIEDAKEALSASKADGKGGAS